MAKGGNVDRRSVYSERVGCVEGRKSICETWLSLCCGQVGVIPGFSADEKNLNCDSECRVA